MDAGRLPEALAAIDAGVARAPTRPELQLLRALVLLEMDRLGDAEEAARRARYLAREDPSAAFLVALVALRRGDPGAARAFRRVISLCERRDPGEQVALSEGLTAGGLAEAARGHLARLGGDGGAPGAQARGVEEADEHPRLKRDGPAR